MVCTPMCFVLQILYYDGQFDDTRMNVALACSAAAAGACVVNHVEATSLIKVCTVTSHVGRLATLFEVQITPML